MVQATEPDTVEETGQDVSQALVLLGEMNNSAQHVAQLVDNMISRVHKGELSTSQGLSFLEMKYHMLLSYLINVTYVVLRKCSGERIEGDPSIDRLVEIRTVLEKIRPIDHKLKYQIDKLVKTAVTGTVEDNGHGPNLDNFISPNVDQDADSETEVGEQKAKSGKYIVPKVAPVHYVDDSALERNKRLLERKKKLSLHASIIEDLKEEYLDIPTQISHGNRAQQVLNRQDQKKQEYEENYLTRLPETKAEKNRRKRFSTIGNLGDDIMELTNVTSGSVKRKRKTGKIKGKGNKRKRFH